MGIEVVEPKQIYDVECDIFSPNALGGVINSDTIPRLTCQIVAGGANNQLLSAADGEELHRRGILYAPDYVINAGGIVNVASEYYDDVDDAEVMRRVAEIGPRLTGIFEAARQSGKPTNLVADDMARARIADA